MKTATPARLILAASLSFAALFLPAREQAAQEERRLGLKPGGYHALVIGNNEYRSVPRLKTAESDARAVEAVLRDGYGFQTRLLLNATRQQIISALNSYRRALDADSSLLIYYAGHGIYDKQVDKAYWLPVDADRDDNSNWISADDVTSNIKGVPAQHVLIVSDSCYSGTLTRGLGESLPQPSQRERYLQRMASGRSRTLMASGGNEPVADAGATGAHSVFAGAFLRGLREMDKSQFTAAEMYREFVEESVAGGAQQTPEYNPLRNSGHEAGDFIFVRVRTPDGKAVEVAVKTDPPRPLDPAAVELSFWETIKGSADPEDFKAYLRQYPAGQFAALAKNRVNNLEAAARPAATAAASPEQTNPAAELAFWESVKNSTSADDFRAYLKKFPNGTFAELANNRLKVLESAEEIVKRTKSFRGAYGQWGGLRAPGELFVSPGGIEFRPSNKSAFDQFKGFFGATSEGNVPLNCAQFREMKLDRSFLRELACGGQKCRFEAESDAAAANALVAIREVCNFPAQAPSKQ
jgi:uncharacterized caspase-like protein